MINSTVAGWLVVILCFGAMASPTTVSAREVEMPDKEYKLLDTFEAHQLSKADKLFNDKEYRAAAAGYDTFILDFPRSDAVSYALVRMARCLHLEEKRFQAIKRYNEVLDYFPNDILYAGAALYYIGQCHWQNGDVEQAMKAWAEMAEDEDYSRHYLAAGAINQLAENLQKQGRHDQAVAYFKQVAIDFRRSNDKSARKAMWKVIPHYVKKQPDESKLREFYGEVRGFEHRPIDVPADLEEDQRYWGKVIYLVERYDDFTDLQRDLRERYFRYWAGVMTGRFPQWDEYQIALANFHRVSEGSVERWMQRIDHQFKEYQEPGDYDRIVKWITIYRRHPEKIAKYYNMLTFAKMSNEAITELLKTCFDSIKDPEMARNVFYKLRLGEMTDRNRRDLERYLWDRDIDLVRDVCMTYDDQAQGKLELLRAYHWRRRHRGDHDSAEKGIVLADEVAAEPKYAAEAFYKKGELLQWERKWEEAIATFRRADNPPSNLFRMAECYAKMGRLEAAIAQLREIENFFKPKAPEAGLRIAYYYRDAGIKDRFISSLRAVLKKYPESGQSSRAHQELEELGVKMGGGVNAED